MTLSVQEKATIHFYEWEYLNRGYYHFDTVINIEAPFRTFSHQSFSDDVYIDDGAAPSLFSRVINILSPPNVQEETEEKDIIPNQYNKQTKRIGFSIRFSKDQEISSIISVEFLNMLSYSDDIISFEIHGSYESISIQIVCSLNDKERIQSHVKAYFPNILIQDIEIYHLGFRLDENIAIADFGLEEEFMRPMKCADNFNLDPLTSIIATMESLHYEDSVLIQIMFKGVSAPWSKSIVQAVSDGQGGSFFTDAPDMLSCAQNKVSAPLFSSVIRIASQGTTEERSSYLASELARSISTISRSPFNKLIPLSNEGYDYEQHLRNVYERTTNRFGMLLNTHELVSFVHYPNKTIVSKKLHGNDRRSKVLPSIALNKKYLLGVNTHNNTETDVTLYDEARLRHTHIIGATGVGKSTLIVSMMLEDMKHGNGCVLFDPHGDIVDDILNRIPEERKDDVIIIDPTDTDFPIGFNLFDADTEAEKIVLSSDLISAFKQHSTAWGDNIQSVLANAINTFMESTKKGTLIEMKRFLMEDSFRNSFLDSVDDPSLHYYWEHEYPMHKKRIAPLLTRIDTFLRPKTVRYMLAQTEGVNFRACIEEKKIVLIKLSQGLIGTENSYLLGSLFLSKFNQAAFSRQSLAKEQRHPYYIYLDEFQNFVTPSISTILSAARKYGLGLILAHQELAQINDPQVLNSVLSNPYSRICFRLGDNDAKKLESGFSYFEQNDLQSLGIGEAIIRIGSANNDCNMETFPLVDVLESSSSIRDYIINRTRERYAKPKATIEELLASLLPNMKRKKTDAVVVTETPKEEKKETHTIKKEAIETEKVLEVSTDNIHDLSDSFKERKEDYLIKAEEDTQIRKHRSLQNFVQSIARQRGWKTSLEAATKSGGRVDCALLKNNIRIALEISVTNTAEYEVKNIQKCIDDGYNLVYMISDDRKHLQSIKDRAQEHIDKKYLQIVHFFPSSELAIYLDASEPINAIPEKRIKGYRVKVNYSETDKSLETQKSITDIIMKALRKK